MTLTRAAATHAATAGITAAAVLATRRINPDTPIQVALRRVVPLLPRRAQDRAAEWLCKRHSAHTTVDCACRIEYAGRTLPLPDPIDTVEVGPDGSVTFTASGDPDVVINITNNGVIVRIPNI